MKIFFPRGQSIAEAEVPRILAERGIVYFKNSDVDSLRSHVLKWGKPYDHPHQESPGLTMIRARYSRSPAGLNGFTSNYLSPHTDRATSDEPPAVVAVLVLSSPSSGGHALLVDPTPLIVELSRRPDFPDLCDSALLAVQKNQAVYPIFDRSECCDLRLRFRDDGIARPFSINPSGDLVINEMRRLCSWPEVLDLRPGEGYIINNYRFLHGRRAFSGERVAARFLASIDLSRRPMPFGVDV